MSLPTETELPSEEDFSTAPVSTADIVTLAQKTPGGKAVGPDEVPIEALRIHCVASEVTRVMNRMLSGEPAPNEWTTAHIVGIPKKPGTTKLEEHRGICLMSCAAKLFNRLLLTRLQPVPGSRAERATAKSRHSGANPRPPACHPGGAHPPLR